MNQATLCQTVLPMLRDYRVFLQASIDGLVAPWGLPCDPEERAQLAEERRKMRRLNGIIRALAMNAPKPGKPRQTGPAICKRQSRGAEPAEGSTSSRSCSRSKKGNQYMGLLLTYMILLLITATVLLLKESGEWF